MESIDVIARLREIKFLDVDAALAAMSGMHAVYEKSIKVTARLLPGSIKKLDGFIAAGDLEGFGIDVHGIKGVFRNIGAITLGNTAAQLERLAKDGDINACGQDYPPFREQMEEFIRQISAAVTEDERREKMDRETLCATLVAAREAASSYDAVRALETVEHLSGLSYNKDVDALLEKVIFALQVFNCKDAIANIDKMEVLLNGGA